MIRIGHVLTHAHSHINVDGLVLTHWSYCSLALSQRCILKTIQHIDGLMQERRNPIANTLELRLSCTNPSICASCDVFMPPDAPILQQSSAHNNWHVLLSRSIWPALYAASNHLSYYQIRPLAKMAVKISQDNAMPECNSSLWYGTGHGQCDIVFIVKSLPKRTMTQFELKIQGKSLIKFVWSCKYFLWRLCIWNCHLPWLSNQLVY